MRRIVALFALLGCFLPTGAWAQATVTSIQGLSWTSPPTGSALQTFSYNCAGGTTPCFPLVTIYDGTNRASVNANGGLNVNLLNNSISVTGTFWQATQPVSGTFWQATQPVSIATMPTTPVSGTFWQAIQPISGTVTANLGTIGGAATAANQNVTAAGVSATSGQGVQGITNGVPVPVQCPGGGTACFAGGGGGGGGPLGVQPISNSQSVNPATSAVFPVSAATLPLPSGAATSANQPTINGDGGANAHVTNFPTTQAVSATVLPLPAGAATAVNQEVTAAGASSTSAQGVQGVTGGVPLPTTITGTLPAYAVTPTFNCGTGCAGGGSFTWPGTAGVAVGGTSTG
jgi:hypothetical protein